MPSGLTRYSQRSAAGASSLASSDGASSEITSNVLAKLDLIMGLVRQEIIVSLPIGHPAVARETLFWNSAVCKISFFIHDEPKKYPDTRGCRNDFARASACPGYPRHAVAGDGCAPTRPAARARNRFAENKSFRRHFL